MSSSYSHAYLERLLMATLEFSDAFESWLATQNEVWKLSPSPLVAPVMSQGSTIHGMSSGPASRLARAALSASAGVGVTGAYFDTGRAGLIDPIANWRYLTQPMAPFTPPQLRSTIAEVVCRLEAMIAEPLTTEEVGRTPFSPADLPPVVWAGASKQWTLHQYRVAVAEGAESLTYYWKERLGRQDADASVFWQETLNASVGARPGKPKLVPPGDPANKTTKSLKAGLQDLGPALQKLGRGLNLAVRNVAAHERQELSEQDAMEMLSAYSMFARMLDQCEVQFADEGADA